MKFKSLAITLALGASLLGLASCGTKKNNNPVDPVDPTEIVDGDNNNSGDNQNSGDTETTGGSTNNGTTTPTTPSVPASFENSTNKLAFLSVGGAQEALYATFNPVENATSYNAYVSTDGNSWTKLDDELVRLYKKDSTYYYRVDAVGLKVGTYKLKVNPVIDSQESETKGNTAINITTIAHDRSGFGFVDGTSSGAYNDDGTLKSNAHVLYITEATKDSVSLNVVTDNKGKEETATGLQNILNLYKKGYDTHPLDVRFVGQITDFATLEGGDICISGSGASKRVSCGITFEGIGNDATIDGFGIRIKNASNVEVRNLGYMNCDSSEGDDCGLQQDNDHVWVHNCDFFYGDAGGDADQAKGDGALDCKKSTYVSFSYNHFYDTGKSNLLGLSEDTTSGLYITYHHNWYDHSDSRHPRVRYYTCHVYNNYYDGNSKYGVGSTLGSSVFVENNYFRNCKYPMMTSLQGSDIYAGGTTADLKNNPTFSKEAGGSIKSFGNVMVGTYTYIPYNCTSYVNAGTTTSFDLTGTTSTENFDAYEASLRNELVPSTVVSRDGGNTYNNFDTASTMYSYTVQTAEEAKVTVTEFAGRLQGGDFKWTFDNSVEDTNYSVIAGLKSALVSYKTDLVSVQGVSGSSNSGSTETPVTSTVTVQSVEEAITALTAADSITAADKESVAAARALYNQLSDEDKATVSNYSKLVACEAAIEALPQEAEVLTFDYSGTFYEVIGSTSTSKGSVTYEGTTYSKCLKMESSTTITFTTTAETTLTIVLGDAEKSVKLDGTITLTSGTNKVITYTLAAGTHTISKIDTTNLFYLSVE